MSLLFLVSLMSQVSLMVSLESPVFPVSLVSLMSSVSQVPPVSKLSLHGVSESDVSSVPATCIFSTVVSLQLVSESISIVPDVSSAPDVTTDTGNRDIWDTGNIRHTRETSETPETLEIGISKEIRDTDTMQIHCTLQRHH